MRPAVCRAALLTVSWSLSFGNSPHCVHESWVPASLPPCSVYPLLRLSSVGCLQGHQPQSQDPTGWVSGPHPRAAPRKGGRQALHVGRAPLLWDAERGWGLEKVGAGPAGTFPLFAHSLTRSLALPVSGGAGPGPVAGTGWRNFIPFLPGSRWAWAKPAWEMNRLAVGGIADRVAVLRGAYLSGGVTVREGAPLAGLCPERLSPPHQSARQRPACPWLCRFS